MLDLVHFVEVTGVIPLKVFLPHVFWLVEVSFGCELLQEGLLVLFVGLRVVVLVILIVKAHIAVSFDEVDEQVEELGDMLHGVCGLVREEQELADPEDYSLPLVFFDDLGLRVQDVLAHCL